MPMLDTLVHGGEVKQHKPAPDPYLLAMERLGVQGRRMEDSAAGIASAARPAWMSLRFLMRRMSAD